MQVATRVPSRARARRRPTSRLGIVVLVVAGVAWLSIAAGSAWLVFGTPLLARLVSLDGRDSAAPILGAVAWAAALTAPACFAILGLARLGGAVTRARHARPDLPPVARLAGRLPPGCSVIPRIHLPEGRTIPDVVVGPHGIAFFERLPPASASRRRGEHWEIRFSDGSWRHVESPLQRAARDADRLRGFLGAAERDFVVRVYPAVAGDAPDVPRIDGCAVVALADVPAWLAALPAQRGLTEDRLASLRDLLGSLAVDV